MGVSENSGTPKSSILIGFSIINHPFWGTPIFGNTHIDISDIQRCSYISWVLQDSFPFPAFKPSRHPTASQRHTGGRFDFQCRSSETKLGSFKKMGGGFRYVWCSPLFGVFPKMVVITQQPWVFPTKNDDFGVFLGVYHHLRCLRKHPFGKMIQFDFNLTQVGFVEIRESF